MFGAQGAVTAGAEDLGAARCTVDRLMHQLACSECSVAGDIAPLELVTRAPVAHMLPSSGCRHVSSPKRAKPLSALSQTALFSTA